MGNLKTLFGGLVTVMLLALSLEVSAAPFYMTADAYGHDTPMWFGSEGEACSHAESHVHPDYTAGACSVTPFDYRQVYVDGVRYTNRRYLKIVVSVSGSTNPTLYIYDFEGVDPLPPGAPGPACESPNVIDPETGECVAPKQPEECREIGEYYDPSNQQCVTECANGAMDSICLTTPDPACSEASADYQGTVGWGDDHRPVCSGDTSCGDNERFAYREMDDGSWGGVCISNESNPPTCPYGFDGVLEIYDNGFACGPLNEDKASDKNDSSDGDSDGDGQADDNGMAGQLEDIKGLLRDGNNEVGNIGQSLKKGFGDLKDAIGNIPGGGGSSGSSQTEIVGEDGNAITWSGSAITMEVQDGLEELNAVQGEYESLIANIRSEMSASFGSFTGAGRLQDNNITLFGQTFNAGLSKFGADLSMIGSIILFAASFAALGIIMGARD